MKMDKQQYITDEHGNKVAVVVPIEEYQKMKKDIEELEDIYLYDQAKKEDDGTRISLEDYKQNRSSRHG